MHGLQTRVHQQGDTTIFESVQDCSAILANARAMHNEGLHGSSETKFAARIPLVVVERFCNTKGITFAEFVGNQAHRKAILNDPDLAGFRIWKGKV
jgi:hypothetical protein